MTLGAAPYLWLLLPAGLLVWWRFKRANEKRFDSSTLAIWRRVLEESRDQKAPQFRFSGRVVVEAIALASLILALCEPQIKEPQRTLLVVDRFGSMSAPGRRAAADEVANGLRKSAKGEVFVFETSDATNIALEQTREFLDVLRQDDHLHLVTDWVPNDQLLKLHASVSIVDAPVRNVGFIAGEAVQKSDGTLDLFFALARSDLLAFEKTRVTIAFDTKETLKKEVDFGSQLRAGIRLALDMPKGASELHLGLNADDELAFDDTLVLVAPRPDLALMVEESAGQSQKALLHTKDALISLGHAPFSSWPKTMKAAKVLVASERVQAKEGAAIVYQSLFLPTASLLGNAPIKGETSLISSIPGLDQFKSGKAFLLNDDASFLVLATCEGKPVIVLDQEKKVIHIACDPGESGWCEVATFPLLLRGLLQALGFAAEDSAKNWQPKKKGAPFLNAKETTAFSDPNLARLVKRHTRAKSLAFWFLLLALGCVLGLLFADVKILKRDS